MSIKIPVFRSPEGETEYCAAYQAALKRWPVPFEELYIPTRFGDTHVIASGSKDAAPMVLFHPSGGSALIWCRNVGPLSRRHRVLAVDTIGEPNKSVLTRPITFRNQRQAFADWASDLFGGLGIDSTYLIGNSFGGFLALNTALALPERIKKLVLISPADTFTRMWGWYWHFPLANMLGSKDAMLKAYEWIWQGFPRDECIGRLRAITARVGRPRHWFPSVFGDAELRRVKTPTLLLIGDREVIYKPEDAIRRAERLMPCLQAEIVPNANHVAEYTAPDVVNERILQFMADGRGLES